MGWVEVSAVGECEAGCYQLCVVGDGDRVGESEKGSEGGEVGEGKVEGRKGVGSGFVEVV